MVHTMISSPEGNMVAHYLNQYLTIVNIGRREMYYMY